MLRNEINTPRSYLRIITVFFVVLGGIIVGSVLTHLENINFLDARVSWISCVLLFTALLLIASHFIRRFRHKKHFFHKFPDARKLALLCQTPRTTRYLRALYLYWEIRHSEVLTGTNNFNDFIKDQEREGVLKCVDGEWHITKKGMEIIANELLYDPRYWDT